MGTGPDCGCSLGSGSTGEAAGTLHAAVLRLGRLLSEGLADEFRDMRPECGQLGHSCSIPDDGMDKSLSHAFDQGNAGKGTHQHAELRQLAC